MIKSAEDFGWFLLTLLVGLVVLNFVLSVFGNTGAQVKKLAGMTVYTVPAAASGSSVSNP